MMMFGSSLIRLSRAALSAIVYPHYTNRELSDRFFRDAAQSALTTSGQDTFDAI